MKVKIAASLALAAGLVSTAHALGPYTVQGTQSYSIDAVTTPIEDGGLGAILTQNPSPPTFSGSWTMDLNTGQFLHSFNFAPYTVSVDMTASSFGVVDITVPNRVLVLTQAASYVPISSDGVNGPGFKILNGLFLETSPGITCNDGGTGTCASVPGPGTPSHGMLQLIFAPDLQSFTGFAKVYQNIDLLAQDTSGVCLDEGGANPCAINTLTFSGTAVPVPASAWLFGSGLLGMIGLKRRKAA